MTRATIFTRTDKGARMAGSGSRELANDLRKVLEAIDGTSSVDALQSKLNFRSADWLDRALAALVEKELICEAQSATGPGLLDFTSAPSGPQIEDSQRKAEEGARRETEERARHEADVKARREAEEKAKARHEADAKARREAEEKTRREAEEKARREAESEARKEAEDKVRRDAEEQKQKLGEEQELKLAAERVRSRAAEAARQEAEKQAKLAEEQELQRAAERVRSRAAEHARKEAEEQARKSAEEQERKAAEEQERHIAAERARQEAEEQARKLAEEQERRKAAERAREEAEAKARKLAEDLARRDAEDKVRREADEKVRREAEEQVRRKAEEQARKDAEEKVRREAEEKARREAEEAARREEEAQGRRETEEKVPQEAVEAARGDAERARQEAETKVRVAAEEKACRESEENLRREQEAAANKLANAKAKTNAKAAAKEGQARLTRSRKWGKPLALGIAALLVAGLVTIHLISFDGQIPQFEKLLAGQFQQPVKIQALRLSLVPQPQLRLEGVSIGSEGQIRIPRLKAIGALGNLSGDKKVFKSVELDSPVVTEAGLGWILFGKPLARDVVFGEVSALNVSLESKNLSLPAFDAKLQSDGDGVFKAIVIESVDKNLNLELTSKGESVQIDFKARSFRIPFGSQLTLDDLVASGTANRNELAVTEFKGFAYGGILSGKAMLKWGTNWSLSGELNAKQVDTSRLLPGLMGDGRLVGTAAYAMQAPDAAKLFAANRLEGDFIVSRGLLLGVDMGRMLQGGAIRGETRFAEVTGSLVRDRGATQLKQVRLTEGAMTANGTVEVDANDNVQGRFAIELKRAAERQRATLAVSGTLKKVEWQRP